MTTHNSGLFPLTEPILVSRRKACRVMISWYPGQFLFPASRFPHQISIKHRFNVYIGEVATRVITLCHLATLDKTIGLLLCPRDLWTVYVEIQLSAKWHTLQTAFKKAPHKNRIVGSLTPSWILPMSRPNAASIGAMCFVRWERLTTDVPILMKPSESSFWISLKA